jgi:hypothetical protein
VTTAKAAVAGHAKSSRCNAQMAPVHRNFMSYCFVDGHFLYETKHFHTSGPSHAWVLSTKFSGAACGFCHFCAQFPHFSGMWRFDRCSRNICSNVTQVLSLPLINHQPIGEESSGCGDGDPGRHAQSPNLFELALITCALVYLFVRTSPVNFF